MAATASSAAGARGGSIPRPRRPRPRYTSLLWRVFVTNAAVMAAASVVTVLVFSPRVLGSPIAVKEVVILVGGLAAVLLVNLLVLRRAFAPLERLTGAMREVDLLRPGQRVPVRGAPSEATELTHAFNEMLDRLEAERQESTGRALAAQESERLRVAQELHDEIGQSLTAVLLQLARTQRRAPAELGDELRDTQETARGTLESVRRIARELRPEALDDLGLGPALAALSDRLAASAGLEIARDLERHLPPLGYEEELVVYRVAQEALTNVVRHAGASRAELSLSRTGSGLRLRVADDGRGLDGARAGAGGIRGMHERALLVGARLSVHGRAPRGVEVTLDVPLPEPAP